ncbi:hypothetical protein [Thioalkalivibrio sulfidiphilus]|uniref:hypothetical protein n=1 Tax=Thioalkalivibrio sulfidiphilus TaxID=1033854 RepID=UPI003B2C2C84
MATVRRRTRGQALDEYRKEELLTGEPCLLAGLGFYDYSAGKFDLEAMRRAWIRHREALMAEWQASQGDGSLPWAAEMFDA